MTNQAAVWFISSIKTFQCHVGVGTLFPCKVFRTVEHVCYNLRGFFNNPIYFSPVYFHYTLSLLNNMYRYIYYTLSDNNSQLTEGNAFLKFVVDSTSRGWCSTSMGRRSTSRGRCST